MNRDKEKAVPCWTADKENEAFRNLPSPDDDKARALLPDLFEFCSDLGRTQSLPWLWILLGLATIVCQLSPRDILELAPSVEVHGALWTCLLHLGSSNSSGLLKLLQKAMELIYERSNKAEYKALKDEHDRTKLAAEAAATQGHGKGCEVKEFKAPPKR